MKAKIMHGHDGPYLEAFTAPPPTTEDIDTESLIAYQEEFDKRKKAYEESKKTYLIHADSIEYAKNNIGKMVDIIILTPARTHAAIYNAMQPNFKLKD